MFSNYIPFKRLQNHELELNIMLTEQKVLKVGSVSHTFLNLKIFYWLLISPVCNIIRLWSDCCLANAFWIVWENLSSHFEQIKKYVKLSKKKKCFFLLVQVYCLSHKGRSTHSNSLNISPNSSKSLFWDLKPFLSGWTSKVRPLTTHHYSWKGISKIS